MAYENAMSTLGNVSSNTRNKTYRVMDHCQVTLGRTPGVLWGIGSSSEHATGRAVDFMISQNGRGLDWELGNLIADYILANGQAFGLGWLIWEQRIYPGSGSFVAGGGYSANPNGGWRKMEDRGSVTQNHYDHVHAYFINDTAVGSISSVVPLASGDAPDLPQPFPLPRDHYYGLITGPDKSHGGYYAAEQPVIKIIQQRLIVKGYVPGIVNPNSSWADGKFEQPTADAVTRFQHAEMPGTTYFGQVWWDDYAQLSK